MGYYALINRARGPYEEIFVLTFKAYGPNAVRSMRLECQNKDFPYGPKSRLIRALLCTYTNKIVYYEIFLELERLVRCPVHNPMCGLPLSQSDQTIRFIFQSVFNEIYPTPR